MNVFVIILIIIGIIIVGIFLYGLTLPNEEADDYDDYDDEEEEDYYYDYDDAEEEDYSKNEFPSWYKGMDENDVRWKDWYEGGCTATSEFSGESVELTAVETAMYDLILGFRDRELTNQEIIVERKVQYWFKVVNPEAYTILISED